MLLGSNKAIRLAGGALETFNILSLKLLLSNRANWGRFSGAVFREYMRLVGTDRWSAASIEALVDCSLGRPIVLEHLPGEGIYTPVDELAYLALITASINPSRVFEIGTFRGWTALNF
ncbi:MAG: hypothetical protein FJ405_10405, partial [Verrucomicrobia bacterium]|nr:hypothetical protein [Verrucomicrobiota bacterium]